MATKKKSNYRYEIELSESMYPRYIADIMAMMGNFAYRLLSVTDLQNDSHVYGARYQVRDENEPEHEPMSHAAMIAHYQALSEQNGKMIEYYRREEEKSKGEPTQAAYAWILALLQEDWVPGNLGMVDSYVKEFVIALDAFRAHMERIGHFAEE